MKPWTPLTHKLLALARKQGWSGSKSKPLKMGVAVSGGADSVALLCLLVELKSSLNLELVVCHLHHGGDSEFRKLAHAFTRDLSDSLNLSFVSKTSPVFLKSEAEMRKFRRDSLRAWSEDLGLQKIALAHHAEDLLETRLIRLLRGTGPQGLRSMKLENGIWLRPVLQCSREELREDLKLRGQDFLEDPSNSSSAYLRNWLRHRILPQIEKKRKGSVASLAQSLERIVEVVDEALPSEMPGLYLNARTWSRSHYENLSEIQQRQQLAGWLRSLGCRNYSHNHVEEMRKQLDIHKREHSFTVLGLSIRANAKQIEATRP